MKIIRCLSHSFIPVVFTVCWVLLPASGDCSEPGLVLWNRLGSIAEITSSEVGLAGSTDPSVGAANFTAGVFGDAYVADHTVKSPLVTFPKAVIPIQAGTIELWGKLINPPGNLAWGANPFFFHISDGTYAGYALHLNGNDGAGNGGLCGGAGHGTATGTGWYGSWTYEQVLSVGQAEEWHHYALVWNQDGIPGVADGRKKIAVFLDGQLESGRWYEPDPDFVPLNGGELGLIFNQHLSQGSVAVDNLKIWGFAKTDFSDRYDEGTGDACNNILFADDFDTGVLSAEWVSKEPAQWIQDGWLHTKDTDGWPRDSMAVVHDSDPSWTDYTVAITAEWVPGTPWENFTLPLRSDGFYRSSAGSSGSAYQLHIDGAGGFPWSIPRVGLTRSTGQSNVELFHQDYPIPSGSMELLISLTGGRIQLWIDGQPVFDVIDPDPLLFGGVGVHAIWEAEARFDNLVVCASEAPPQDEDGDGHDAEVDCDDNDPNNWVSCATCADGDEDGFFTGCDAYVSLAGPDCDDDDYDVYPGASELCNGIDDDCDGSVPATEADEDQDGFRVCAGDCNDAEPAIHPLTAEVCDGVDNDCDGDIDEGFDVDADGYTSCGGDCNDGDADIHPAAAEPCDGIDNDCSGAVDDGPVPCLACAGFEPPMHLPPVTVQGKNRALPHKARLLDATGVPVTDLNLAAPPVIQVLFDPGTGGASIDVSDDALAAGQGTDGNQFTFTDEERWQFNLKTRNYTASGTYLVYLDTGDPLEYEVFPVCETAFVVE